MMSNYSSKLSKQEFNPPKGMRDIDDKTRIDLIKSFIDKMTDIFQRYDAVQIETPVLENMKLINKLYGGEFNKLVFAIDRIKPYAETNDVNDNMIRFNNVFRQICC
jgi:hypothetical protein